MVILTGAVITVVILTGGHINQCLLYTNNFLYIAGVMMNAIELASESKVPLKEKLADFDEHDKYRHVIKILHEVNSRS